MQKFIGREIEAYGTGEGDPSGRRVAIMRATEGHMYYEGRERGALSGDDSNVLTRQIVRVERYEPHKLAAYGELSECSVVVEGLHVAAIVKAARGLDAEFDRFVARLLRGVE